MHHYRRSKCILLKCSLLGKLPPQARILFHEQWTQTPPTWLTVARCMLHSAIMRQCMRSKCRAQVLIAEMPPRTTMPPPKALS